jgi:pimeloyl-ACP methyl ester carboxylesterase
MHSDIFSNFTGLLATGLLAATIGCASNGPSSTPSPATPYVVVHGSWQGASDWDEVATQMRAQGAKVTVVELQAHGTDQTPIAEASLDAYTARVQAAVDAAGGPVILVGHSFGGMVISAVAEQRASQVEKLIYVGAFVPKDGDSLLGLAKSDPGTHLGDALSVDEKAGTIGVAIDKLGDVFCADCSAPTLAALQQRYRVEPLAPLATPVHLTAENWGKVPKYYVYTKNDHAISFAAQRSMTDRVKLAGEATLETSHCPFLSQPALVVSTLLGF